MAREVTDKAKKTNGNKKKRSSRIKRRSNPAQNVFNRREVSSVLVVEETRFYEDSYTEPAGVAVETHLMPSSLTANTSAFDGSLVSAPALCNNSVTGNVNINCSVIVAQSSDSVISEDSDQAQEAVNGAEEFTKTVLRTPKKFRRTPQVKLFRRKARIPNRFEASCARRLNFGDEQRPAQHRKGRARAGKQPLSPVTGGRVKVQPPSHMQCSITGGVTGVRVTATYRCNVCDNKLRPFTCEEFSVKCAECEQSWRCSKMKFTCAARITVEPTNGRRHSVTLCDSLLRKVVSYEATGYCNTDQIENQVLKMDSIRVHYEDGHPQSVEMITSTQEDPGVRGSTAGRSAAGQDENPGLASAAPVYMTAVMKKLKTNCT